MLTPIQVLIKPAFFTRHSNKIFLFIGLFLFVNFRLLAQTCPVNIDFELGNFQGWQCYVGSTTSSGGNNIITVATSPVTATRHTIIPKGTQKDPLCGIPMSAPNGSGYSIQLGNSGTGSQAERVTYQFTVPQGQQDFVITYQYAVVLEDPNHPPEQQPRFSAKVFDVAANSYISCGSFDYVATSNLPGFSRAGVDILYKNWTPVTLRLNGYQGKKILLEFTTADCGQGGHFGYAYVDVNANCSTVITGSDYCAGTPAINLQAPAGYETYNWYNADRSKLLGTGSNLFMAPTPPDGTSIVLDIVPYAGFGCNNTITATLHEKPAINFNVTDPAPVCTPATIDLTDKKLIGTSDPALNYTYWQDSLATVTVYSPKNVSVSGTYYIQAASSTCAEIKPIHVVVSSPPQFTITNPATVCATSVIDLTAKNIKSDTTVSYTYWKDNQATIPLSTPNHLVWPNNTYYIKGTNIGGCTTIKPVLVTFYPLPVLKITNPLAVCYPATVDISATGVTAGSDANLTLTYYTDSIATIPLDHYDLVAKSGIYYIKAVNANGCQIIKPVKVTIHPLPNLIVTNPTYVCLLDKVDITAAAVTAGSSNIALLTYWKDTSATVPLATPKAIADSGVYFIKATSADGCEIVKSVLVTVHNPPVVKITDPAKVYQPTKVDLTLAAITQGSSPRVTYSYWYNEAATISIMTPKAIDRTATYYIKGTSEYGCYTIMPVNVVVAEIPEIKIPTAFTPTQTSNNRLYPFLIGIKKFTMLRVYNKWGNIVFQTTDPSPEKGWDGSFRGNTSFMETFSWIAEGYDYVGNLVHKTGNTLLLK